jgi:hypothetical protein
LAAQYVTLQVTGVGDPHSTPMGMGAPGGFQRNRGDRRAGANTGAREERWCLGEGLRCYRSEDRDPVAGVPLPKEVSRQRTGVPSLV